MNRVSGKPGAVHTGCSFRLAQLLDRDMSVEGRFRRRTNRNSVSEWQLKVPTPGPPSCTTTRNVAGDLPWLPVWNMPARSRSILRCVGGSPLVLDLVPSGRSSWSGRSRATSSAPGSVQLTVLVRALILFDKDCGFCRWSLSKIMAWDRHGCLRSVALQSPEADDLLKGMDPEQKMASWHLVGPDGRTYSGGEAVSPPARLLPAGAPLASLASAFPRTMDRAYRWVARHRDHLGRAPGDRFRCYGNRSPLGPAGGLHRAAPSLRWLRGFAERLRPAERCSPRSRPDVALDEGVRTAGLHQGRRRGSLPTTSRRSTAGDRRAAGPQLSCSVGERPPRPRRRSCPPARRRPSAARARQGCP